MFNDDKNKLTPKQGYHASTQRFASKIHYTITPIENIKAWKTAWYTRSEADKLKLAEARTRAIDAVEGQSLSLIHDRESQYLDQISLRAFSKYDFYEYDKKGFLVRKGTANSLDPIIKHDKSLLQKLKDWFK